MGKEHGRIVAAVIAAAGVIVAAIIGRTIVVNVIGAGDADATAAALERTLRDGRQL